MPSRRMPEVLFVCVHNAGRSQMAAALLRRRTSGRITVRSAGSEPATHLNPTVVAAMLELGIDISHERPSVLTTEAGREADVIVTMGCDETCPVYPGKRYVSWDLPDPAGQPIEAVRDIRDTIDRHVQALADDLLGDHDGTASHAGDLR